MKSVITKRAREREDTALNVLYLMRTRERDRAREREKIMDLFIFLHAIGLVLMFLPYHYL